MNNIDIKKIRTLADINLSKAILHRNKLAKRGKRLLSDEAMIYTLGIDAADGHLNGLLSLGNSKKSGLLDEAIDFFSEEKRDFIVWIRDHLDLELELELKLKGYLPMREPGIAGMMINNPIEKRETPHGYQLKKVESLKAVSDYAQVVKDAFSKEDDVLDIMYGHIESLMASNISAFVLYKGDEPVAASMTLVSDCVAGIYYLGTKEGHRGHGIGTYMTTISTNVGFDMGADTVILQASLLGEPIYKKLGYEVITYYRWYKIQV